MKGKINLLLVALGFGFLSAASRADCDPCNQESPPIEANCPPGEPPIESGSMPEGFIIDDVTPATDEALSTSAGAKNDVKEASTTKPAAQ